MKYTIPDKFMGVSTSGQIKRVQIESVQRPSPALPRKIASASPSITDLQNYILLQGRTYGGQSSYPDLLVSKERFYHSKTWAQTHEALHKGSFQMLTIRQFVDFLNLLKSGNAVDGRGYHIQKSELINIFNDITEVRSPWRAEWLDADFKVYNGVLHINYNHRFVNGQLQPQNSEPLEACLMEDKTPGIDLESWLKNANSQGLPPEKVKYGELNYWCPKKNNISVAGFDAGSVRVNLYCSGGPVNSNSSLGVRKVAPLGAN